MILKRLFFIALSSPLLLIILPQSLKSQGNNWGQVTGNFQTDVQVYRPDSAIGITEGDLQGEKAGMNAQAKFIYTLGNFSAGLRYEAFLKPLVGFDDAWEGHGIANRYLNYTADKFEVTVGNFYDEFGSGMIFRAYEEWNLGYDNSVDGVRVKFNVIPGISIKGIYGTQRYYWKDYLDEPKKRGIVRGVDGEFSLNDFIPGMTERKFRIIAGGSFVSKYEKDDPSAIEYKMPENVSAYAGRLSISHGKFGIEGEYAYKINDPSELNNYIYKNGQALHLTARYSQKGLGVLLTAKRIDNMYYKSRRTETANALDINFLPPITKQQTYSLMSMYPYATQPAGETGLAGEVVYTIPKGSKLGGKYGTNITVDYSLIYGIEKTMINDTTPVGTKGTLGYESAFFKPGDTKYFEDFTLELTRKFSPKFKAIAAYSKQSYNYDVIEEGIETGHVNYNTDIVVLDMTYMLSPKKALRLETQYLSTRQDSGNWVGVTVEYSIAPTWFITLMDEYNFNNPSSDNTYHYYNFAFGYTNKANRISLSYGRHRDGIICVGGVCRNVPASSGLTITLTSSF